MVKNSKWRRLLIYFQSKFAYQSRKKVWSPQFCAFHWQPFYQQAQSSHVSGNSKSRAFWPHLLSKKYNCNLRIKGSNLSDIFFFESISFFGKILFTQLDWTSKNVRRSNLSVLNVILMFDLKRFFDEFFCS